MHVVVKLMLYHPVMRLKLDFERKREGLAHFFLCGFFFFFFFFFFGLFTATTLTRNQLNATNFTSQSFHNIAVATFNSP